MEQKIVDSVSKLVKKRRKFRINQKVVIFCFFLLFSSVIWYLNKLGGDYLVDLKLPVKFVYTETDKLLVDEGSSTLKIQVKTKGYTILRYQLGSILSPLRVDISSYRLHRAGRGRNEYFLLTSVLRSNLSTQLPSNMKIENITPDTLYFSFSRSYSKRVPVVPATNLTFEDQYMQVGSVKLSPDSVLISGPESVIRNKRFVRTEAIKGELLSEPISGTVSILEEKNILLKAKEVGYTIEVAKFTERTLKLPVYSGVSDSTSVLVIPSQVDVSFKVSLKDYERIVPSQFHLSIPFDERKLTSNRIKVRVDTFPSFVSGIKVVPEFVEIYRQKQ
jgi:hypothetical protein